jgi:hypothetical protein
MSQWREEETGPSGFTLAQQIACVKREIALRLRFIQAGWRRASSTAGQPCTSRPCMTQVLRTLEALIDDGR